MPFFKRPNPQAAERDPLVEQIKELEHERAKLLENAEVTQKTLDTIAPNADRSSEITQQQIRNSQRIDQLQQQIDEIKEVILKKEMIAQLEKVLEQRQADAKAKSDVLDVISPKVARKEEGQVRQGIATEIEKLVDRIERLKEEVSQVEEKLQRSKLQP